jgi:hypothetical protein
MRWTAEKGETKGAIALRINFMEDEDDDDDEEYVLLRRLNDILLIEEVKKNFRTSAEDFEGSKIYEWILKQIQKTGVFDGVRISLNDNYEMEYFWEVDDE